MVDDTFECLVWGWMLGKQLTVSVDAWAGWMLMNDCRYLRDAWVRFLPLQMESLVESKTNGFSYLTSRCPGWLNLWKWSPVLADARASWMVACTWICLSQLKCYGNDCLYLVPVDIVSDPDSPIRIQLRWPNWIRIRIQYFGQYIENFWNLVVVVVPHLVEMDTDPDPPKSVPDPDPNLQNSPEPEKFPTLVEEMVACTWRCLGWLKASGMVEKSGSSGSSSTSSPSSAPPARLSAHRLSSSAFTGRIPPNHPDLHHQATVKESEQPGAQRIHCTWNPSQPAWISEEISSQTG